ncbi:MAG: hypothetical protein EA401_00670 [Planctomycetota bacterium]|nr:MAG: hypothetical protein EA401_00670 [Planctomycetota bacterium]
MKIHMDLLTFLNANGLAQWQSHLSGKQIEDLLGFNEQDFTEFGWPLAAINMLKDALYDAKLPGKPVGVDGYSSIAPVGAEISGYTVLAILGQSHSGGVYKVRCPHTHKVAVIKTQALSCSNERPQRQAFKRDVAALKEMVHPGVVAVLDHGEDPQYGLFYIIEYLDGETLAQRVLTTKPTTAQLFQWWGEITSIVARAHKVDVSHRDIRPQNIFFRAGSDQPVVTDWNLGLPMRPPEPKSWSPLEIKTFGSGIFTDVYSLAGLLGWLLTHYAPMVLEGSAALYLEATGKIHRSLPEVLRRSLSMVRYRPGNAGELLQAIRNLLMESAGTPSPASSKRQRCWPAWAADVGEDSYRFNGRWWADLLVKGIRYRMRWIAPGTFIMGDALEEGNPPHQVILSRGFWMGQTPVTRAFYGAIHSSDPSFDFLVGGPGHPVQAVTHLDGVILCERLNEMFPGMDARLPTEAQWEYACRADTQTPFWCGNSLSDIVAHYSREWGEQSATSPVEERQANPWGLQDMHGNVGEWCADWYAWLGDEPVVDPVGPSEGDDRVFRGGGWLSSARYCRSASRGRLETSRREKFMGLRLVIIPPH